VDLGSRPRVSELRLVYGLGVRVCVVGIGVWAGLGFRVEGLGFRGVGFRN